MPTAAAAAVDAAQANCNAAVAVEQASRSAIAASSSAHRAATSSLQTALDAAAAAQQMPPTSPTKEGFVVGANALATRADAAKKVAAVAKATKAAAAAEGVLAAASAAAAQVSAAATAAMTAAAAATAAAATLDVQTPAATHRNVAGTSASDREEAITNASAVHTDAATAADEAVFPVVGACSSRGSSERPHIEAEPDEELFELVDEHTGFALGITERRAVCHKQGLWHRAVYVFVYDTEGHLLLQRRSAAKKVSPGCWDLSCAEHLCPGESFRQGAARGLVEELGIDLTELHRQRIASDLHSFSDTSADSACHGHGVGAVAACTASEAAPQAPTSTAVNTIGDAPGATGAAESATLATDSALIATYAARAADFPLEALDASTLLVGPLSPAHPRRLVLPEISLDDCEWVEAYRLDGLPVNIPLSVNLAEVQETQWVAVPAELKAMVAADPEAFTPWLLAELQLLHLLD